MALDKPEPTLTNDGVKTLSIKLRLSLGADWLRLRTEAAADARDVDGATDR